MYDRVDEKGKVFTPRVRTAAVEVEVTTIHGLVHGFMHVKVQDRMRDELNRTDEDFIAMTGANIRTRADSVPQKVGFIALNKRHIVSVVPISEPRPVGEDDYNPWHARHNTGKLEP